MNGLKRVRERRTDELAQVDWRKLEVLLAVHYRSQGYAVEHVGTGATNARSDGGIDLKLRRNDEYVLVQVKHWNAYQVPHNDVHQLLGLMVNEGATGAVLITSGEFTKAAVEAATKQGHVQLIAGEELRVLLGPLPGSVGEKGAMEPRERPSTPQGNTFSVSRRGDLYEATNGLFRVTGGRLFDAAENRTRRKRRGGPHAYAAVTSGLDLLLLKLATAAVLFGLFWLAVQFAIQSLRSSLTPAAASVPATTPSLTPVLMTPAEPAALELPQSVKYPSHHRPTAAEIRESQRKADEAMRVIEATTPEM